VFDDGPTWGRRAGRRVLRLLRVTTPIPRRCRPLDGECRSAERRLSLQSSRPASVGPLFGSCVPGGGVAGGGAHLASRPDALTLVVSEPRPRSDYRTGVLYFSSCFAAHWRSRRAPGLPAHNFLCREWSAPEISIVVAESITGAVVTFCATGIEGASVTVFGTEAWRFPSLEFRF
jgi:hypothetical protein